MPCPDNYNEVSHMSVSLTVLKKFLNPIICVVLKLDPIINPICGLMHRPRPGISKKV